MPYTIKCKNRADALYEAVRHESSDEHTQYLRAYANKRVVYARSEAIGSMQINVSHMCIVERYTVVSLCFSCLLLLVALECVCASFPHSRNPSKVCSQFGCVFTHDILMIGTDKQLHSIKARILNKLLWELNNI